MVKQCSCVHWFSLKEQNEWRSDTLFTLNPILKETSHNNNNANENAMLKCPNFIKVDKRLKKKNT